MPSDEWSIGEVCPKCGGKTNWINLSFYQDVESGYFKCTKCGAKSPLKKYKFELIDSIDSDTKRTQP